MHVVFSLLKDIPVSHDTEWIGWDSIAQQLRSWRGELSGGRGAGTWNEAGHGWISKTTSTLRDGKQGVAQIKPRGTYPCFS